jgi:hypothetical protein
VTDFNYDAPAEFYGWRGQGMRRGVVSYRRFSTAAEAIRFAIEDVSSAALGGCALEANGKRIQGREILKLYTSSKFPLQRAYPSGRRLRNQNIRTVRARHGEMLGSPIERVR